MRRDHVAVIAIAVGSLLLLALAGASVPYEPPDGDPSVPEGPSDPEDSSRDEMEPASSLELPIGFLFALGLVIGLAAVLAYWFLFRSSTAATAQLEAPPPVEQRDDAPSLEAVADVAGEAADRLEGTDSFENDVYRTWWAMTRALHVRKPRTKSPGEFATAAVQAGMAPADVRELTRLFTDVRYGNRAPTTADEQQAIALLESIEAEYGSDEP